MLDWDVIRGRKGKENEEENYSSLDWDSIRGRRKTSNKEVTTTNQSDLIKDVGLPDAYYSKNGTRVSPKYAGMTDEEILAERRKMIVDTSTTQKAPKVPISNKTNNTNKIKNDNPLVKSATDLLNTSKNTKTISLGEAQKTTANKLYEARKQAGEEKKKQEDEYLKAYKEAYDRINSMVGKEVTKVKQNVGEIHNVDKYTVPKADRIATSEEIKDNKKISENNTIRDIKSISSKLGVGLTGMVPNTINYIDNLNKRAVGKTLNVLGLPEGVSDVIADNVAKNIPKVGELEKLVSDYKKWRNTKTIENNFLATNNTVKKAGDIIQSVGENLVPAVVSAINPTLGTTLFMTSAAGNYLEDAEQKGMSKDASIAYATVMGLLEGGTEAVITGGQLSNAIKLFNGKGLNKKMLESYGINIAENFFQEAIMEPLQEATATIVAGKEKADWDNILNRMLESGFDGIISAIMLNGIYSGIGKAGNLAVGKQLSNKELQKIITDTINSGKVDIEDIVKGATEAIKQQGQTYNIPVYEGNNIADIVEVKGQNVNIPNNKLNRQIAVVNIDNGYVAIDADTGTRLDIVYPNKFEAIESINNKIDNLENYQVDILRKRINEAQKQMEMETAIAETNNAEQTEIGQNDILNNEATNNITNQEKDNSNKKIKQENNYRDEIIKEVENSYISEENKTELLDAIQKTENITKDDLSTIKDTIKTINEYELPTKANYKNDPARKQKYIQYKNDDSDYDSKIVNEVLDTIPVNRNGKRTVKQWLKAAEEIGSRIANKSNPEIERIAYKSWFDLQPIKNITRYDNQTKTNQAFQKLTSDEWINTINNAVIEGRKNNTNNTIENINSKIEKAYNSFMSSKETAKREDIAELANALNVYHRGSVFIDKKMKQKSGHNKNPKITEIDKFFKNYIDKEDLRKQAYEYAFNTYKNKIIPIKDIKTNVDIPQTGIKKTFGKNQDDSKMQSANNLPNIIEEGIYLNSSKSIKNSNIIYHYFYAPISINNNNEISLITIKEDTSNPKENNKFYYHDIRNLNEIDLLINNKKKDKAHAMPHNSVSNMLFEQSPSSNINNSITQKETSVKEKTIANNKDMQQEKNNTNIKNKIQNFLNKTESNMTVDEFISKFKDMDIKETGKATGEKKEFLNLVNELKQSDIVKEDDVEYPNKKVDINKKKKYNKYSSNLTNREKEQIRSEVRTWRLNEEDGTHYIDLSKYGYESYIYIKDGANIVPIKRVEGTPEYLNAIRKGIENGTFRKSKTINQWLTVVKNQTKNNRSNNVSVQNRESNTDDVGLSNRENREKGKNNRRNVIESNNKNGLKNSKQSSFIMPKYVKDINNLNKFLQEVTQNETNKYWLDQLKEAQEANYIDWTRKESRLQWKRRLVQKYLDYKNNIEYSDRKDILQDSEGNKLTKEQQVYYKDNDVLDDKGNLLVLYHGTPFGRFTKFNDKNMYFFSTDKQFAEDYGYQKSFEQALDGDIKVMEVYLKAKNVFDPSNIEHIEKLKNALTDKIRFWGTTFDKETYLDRIQRKYELQPKWTKEQISNAKFGRVIGNDRDGYNNDIFIGINNNDEVVYTPHAYGRALEYLTDKEKDIIQKNLLEGKEEFITLYSTPFGQMTENAIKEKIQKINQQEKHYLTDIVRYLEEGKDYMVDSSTYKIHVYTATQKIEHLTDIDNWEYLEGSYTYENDEVGNDIIDVIKELGFDGLKMYEKGQLNYAVFNKNQIKSIDNKNPTSNEDILKENDAAYKYIQNEQKTHKPTKTLKDNGRDGDILYRKFKKDFIDKGYTDLNNSTINSKEDLADIAQVFRNPKYETFRMIYMKGNKIVGHEAISSKIPNASMVYKTDKHGKTNSKKDFYKINDRMKRLGADGYYMVHNHPTGHAKASQADINATATFKKNVSGFKGHLILNSGTYAWIREPNSNSGEYFSKPTLLVENNVKIANYKQDEIDKMMNKNPIIDNITLNNLEEITKLIDNIKNSDNYSVLIYADTKLKTRMVQEIHNNFFNMKEEQIKGYLRNQARKNGAANIFLATSNEDSYNLSEYLINQSYLLDSILYKWNQLNGFNVPIMESMRSNKKIDYDKNALFGKVEGLRTNETEDEAFEMFKDTTKERRFYKNAYTSINDSLYREKLEKERDKYQYEPISNKVSIEKAGQQLTANFEQDVEKFKKIKSLRNSSDVAFGEVLIQKAIAIKDYISAIDLTAELGSKLTNAGQIVQAAAALRKMTPEGMLRFAQKQIDNINDELKSRQWIEDKVLHKTDLKQIELTPEKAKFIIEKMQRIQELEQQKRELEITEYKKKTEKKNQVERLEFIEREESILLGQVLSKIGEDIPPSILDKLTSWRNISLLLNPKTIVRNVIGNTGFTTLENINDVASVPVDKIVSLITGQRSVVLPSLKTQKQGFQKGLNYAIEDSKLGINTSSGLSKYDVKPGHQFNNKTLQKLETASLFGVEGMDRPFMQAAYEDALRKIMKVEGLEYGIDRPTEEMRTEAREMAEYRTFKNPNVFSGALSKLKRGLNFGKPIGLADALGLTYTNIPGNLTSKTIDYSPISFAKAVAYGIQMNKAIKNGESGRTQQRKMVQSITRGMIGSGILAISFKAAAQAIISASGDDEKDKLKYLEQSMGKQNYALNVSALGRWVRGQSTKMQKGDLYVTYSNYEPISSMISIGAELFTSQKEDKSIGETLTAMGETWVNTILQLSTLSTFSDLFEYGNLGGSLINQISQFPSSFVPTFARQIAQLIDKNNRSTYSEDRVVQYFLNPVLNRLPGGTQLLQKSYTTLGEERKSFDNTSGLTRVFNVFLNPSFVSTIKYDDVKEELYDLYYETGEVSHLPKYISKSFTYRGEKIVLTSKERAEYQKQLGEKTAEEFKKYMSTNEYKNLSSNEKISKLSSIITKLNNEVKGNVVLEPRELAYETKFSPNTNNLSMNNKSLQLDTNMQKEYETIAESYYNKNKGLVSDDSKLITSAKTYAKKQMFDKYSNLVK